MKTLKIEMIHDVVCSWCPIGYANMQQALGNLDIKADMHFLPYELNPDMGPEGEGINEHLQRRYHWSQSRLQDYRTHLLAVAKQAGVVIDFSKRSHYYNSSKAHRLIHWSEGYNRQQAMNERLIEAYFKRGLDISSTSVLLTLVEELGLDRSQAQQVLLANEIDPQLRLKQQRVQQLELTGVPAFLVNEHTVISGSNSVAYFETAIKRLTENQPNVHVAC